MNATSRNSHLVYEFGTTTGACVTHNSATSPAVVLTVPEGELRPAEHAIGHRDIRHPLAFFLQDGRDQDNAREVGIKHSRSYAGRTMCMRHELSRGSLVRVLSSGGAVEAIFASVLCSEELPNRVLVHSESKEEK